MKIPLKACWKLLSTHVQPPMGRFVMLVILLLGTVGLRVFTP